MKELFPQVEKIEPPPKIRKKRKLLHNFSTQQNSSRYYRHRMIRKEGTPVILEPKLLKMQCELGFDISKQKHILILIQEFGYALEAIPFIKFSK